MIQPRLDDPVKCVASESNVRRERTSVPKRTVQTLTIYPMATPMNTSLKSYLFRSFGLSIVVAVAQFTNSISGNQAYAQQEARAIVSADTHEWVGESINRLGADLHDQLVATENLILSPASISTGLGMIYSGAKGDTAKQMAKTLYVPVTPGKISAAYERFRPGIPSSKYSFGARVIANSGYGIKVEEVLDGSLAAEANLHPQDLIFSINGKPIRAESEYAEAIESADGKFQIQSYRFETGTLESRTVERQNKPSPLEFTNAIWAERNFQFSGPFVDQLRVGFDADLNQVNFATDPSRSRMRINHWIAEKTRRKITELFAPDAITNDTRLVVTNVLYFKDVWKYPFQQQVELAWTGPNVQEGESRMVAGMQQTNSFPYYEDDRVQIVELPYQTDSLSMLLILPREGQPWSETRAAFSEMLRADQLATLQPQRVDLTMPKFRLESRTSLKNMLMKSMPLAFSQQANFAGMSGSSDLQLFDVVHASFIEVDEKGTEAGAATGATIGLKSAPIPFVANRPFMFVLRDRQTGAAIFIGQLIDPQS